MRLLVAAVAGGIVASSLAWSKGPVLASPRPASVELARREVPGAALLFPKGKVTRDEPGLQTGKLQIELGDGGRAQIGWTTGDPLSAAELDRTLIRPLRQSMGLSIAQLGPVRVAGNAGNRWVLRNDNGSMIVSVWSCGKREFHLIVVRQGESPSGLEQRIRDSFVCKSDPARNGKTSPSKSTGRESGRRRAGVGS
jgi:hypothetical protein